MKEALTELNFKYIPQDGIEAWLKYYRGFKLFIAKVKNKEIYIASIAVLGLEISIPNNLDKNWLIEFDKLNN